VHSTSPPSGNYWVKPTGYSGAAEQVAIDVGGSGTYSGITDDTAFGCDLDTHRRITVVLSLGETNRSINGPDGNPTAQGTDDTDTNDDTWRYGRFYFRYTGGSATAPLPIKGIWNADVDGSNGGEVFSIQGCGRRLDWSRGKRYLHQNRNDLV
jgi:hypothetical protein